MVFCRRAIRAAFKNKERAAILTTHYMEEADAVCDRVAILVSGQLRYHRSPPLRVGVVAGRIGQCYLE